LREANQVLKQTKLVIGSVLNAENKEVCLRLLFSAFLVANLTGFQLFLRLLDLLLILIPLLLLISIFIFSNLILVLPGISCVDLSSNQPTVKTESFIATFRWAKTFLLRLVTSLPKNSFFLSRIHSLAIVGADLVARMRLMPALTSLR
jgi:hypothetical protein